MHLISRPEDSRFPYLPGIDALRALAVLAVFFYHSGVGWMPGGFLGVDLFFVISGYLITSLLLREFRSGGAVHLGRFWLRRAKRLLPAVGVMIALTMVVAAIVEPDRIDALRGDALASLAYFANWHFIFSDQSYFEQFQRPSLFTHLWSLSVEEQFYLFWPLVFAAGMKLFGRRRLLFGVLAGALGSVVLAWILFDPGSDASRIYYGTDTHAVGLLAGVALALVWSPIELRRRRSGPLVGPILDAVGVLALAYVVLSFLRVHDYDLALYHGGYLWLAIVVALLLAAMAHPAARLGTLVGSPPVLWLGLRSYSFYLWHWPVLALTRPGLDVELSRGILIPLQLAFVLLLADLSYRFVELPFRGKVKLRAVPDGWLRVARPALGFSVLAVVAVIGWSGLFDGAGAQFDSATASTATSATVRAQPPVAHPPSPAPRGWSLDPWRPVGKKQPLPPARRPPRILALGDSVMIGARDKLAARLGPGFAMSAKVGRQADEFVAIVQRLRREGHRPDAMIIQMGNNGPLYGEDMEAIQKATSEVGELFLINDHAPVGWVEESDHSLAEAARDWPHTTLIDWKSAAEAGQGLLWDDIHLTPAGAGVYARLVSAAVHEGVTFPAQRTQRGKARKDLERG
ncbi:MAG TPA: acyltransferase family protein [Solirubrobacterales bacterium]|jgi:peptidoglycan/LPS O-acetylase OafA/YrhL